MADENIITWNVSNWVTVVLMAAVGIAIIGVIQKYVTARKGS